MLRTSSVIAYLQHSSLRPLTLNNVPRCGSLDNCARPRSRIQTWIQLVPHVMCPQLATQALGIAKGQEISLFSSMKSLGDSACSAICIERLGSKIAPCVTIAGSADATGDRVVLAGRVESSVHWGILARYFVDHATSGPLDMESLVANASTQFPEDLLQRKVHTLVPQNWRWRCARPPRDDMRSSEVRMPMWA